LKQVALLLSKWNQFSYAARPGASAHRVAHHLAHRQLLHLRRASGCFGTSCGLSRDSSSTTSPMSRVRVPRHGARLVMRLAIDYFASRRLVVDYFAYATRSGASARRAARRRLLHLRRASGCFGTSRGLSRDSSSTTSPRAGSSSTTSPRAGSSSTTSTRAGLSSTTSTTPRVRVLWHIARLVTRLVMPLVIDYFTYTACPGASARRAARHAARRQLLQLCRASQCLGTSRGS
jgi:hypothetical protein